MSSELLFEADGIRVTPGWFTHAGTSHAMRTVVRVSLVDRTLPRAPWRSLFVAAVLLIIVSGITLLREVLPWWLGFGLFTASVLLALAAARFAFVMPDLRRLEVVLGDGTQVVIERPGNALLDDVHAALLRAMDWHHGSLPGGSYGAGAAASAAAAAPSSSSGPRATGSGTTGRASA